MVPNPDPCRRPLRLLPSSAGMWRRGAASVSHQLDIQSREGPAQCTGGEEAAEFYALLIGPRYLNS